MAKFNKLDVPHQWKDEFTKYPHGYTIFEALCKWVKQVDNMVDNINNWNDYLDNFVENFEFELQEEVQSTIERWQSEGLLDGIIESALNTELDNVKTQLAHKTTHLKSKDLFLKAKDNNSRIRPLLTIISDDGHADDWEMFEWFQAKGVKAGIAMITGYLEGNNQYFNPTQLKEIYDAGWDIQFHGTNHIDMTTLSESQLETEMKSGISTLAAYGIKCEGLVVPYGAINPLVSKVAERHFKYAFGANVGKRNTEGITTYNLQRIVHGNEYTWQHYKNAVDNAVRENAWSVIVTHWYQLNAEQKQLMMDMIDYAKSEGVDIVTTKEALEIYGNVVEYTNYETGNFFAVSKAGNTFGKNIVNKSNIVLDNTKKYSDPIESYDFGKITYTQITGSEAANFPEGRNGVLVTVRMSKEVGFQKQFYYVSVVNRIYVRTTNSDGVWGNFARQVAVTELERTVEMTSVPAKGDAERTISATGANYSRLIQAIPKVELPRGISYCVFVHPSLNNIIVRFTNVTDNGISIPETQWTIQVG